MTVGLLGLLALYFASEVYAQNPVCVQCDTGQTIANRFPPPEGFRRVTIGPDSFGDWVRHLILLPQGASSHDWRGTVALGPDEVAGVLDWRLLGFQEQCADVALRLVAEFAFQQRRPDQIRFRSLSGESIEWTKWLSGRYGVNYAQTHITYFGGTIRAGTAEELDRYLKFVMNYTNTASMVRDWPEVPESQLAIGDVVIQPYCTGQGTGHLSVVVDQATDEDGNVLYLFMDGYTPARVPVIRSREPQVPQSAWMTPDQYLEFQRQFGPGTFHRYPLFADGQSGH